MLNIDAPGKRKRARPAEIEKQERGEVENRKSVFRKTVAKRVLNMRKMQRIGKHGN